MVLRVLAATVSRSAEPPTYVCRLCATSAVCRLPPAAHRLKQLTPLPPSPLPQLAVKNVFIRGSVVRYIQIPASEVDVQLLQDSCRKDSQSGKGR